MDATRGVVATTHCTASTMRITATQYQMLKRVCLVIDDGLTAFTFHPGRSCREARGAFQDAVECLHGLVRGAPTVAKRRKVAGRSNSVEATASRGGISCGG